MNRSDFYFKQNVTQGEVDQAFDDCENADRNLVADYNDDLRIGSTPAAAWGVISGMRVTEKTGTPDLNVEISNGVAYDEDGRRTPHSGGPTLVDLTTAVPGSDSRYVRVYAEFTRILTDPRTDGLGSPIDYRKTESVLFSFDAGTIAASPTKPAILSGKVCLATVLLTAGQTQILDSDISMALQDPDLIIPDRQEGGFAALHGRMTSIERPIKFDWDLSRKVDVIDTGWYNNILIRGGFLKMSKIGDLDGNAILMEKATMNRAKEILTEGPPSQGYGYWYCNQVSATEYGDLLAVPKYVAYDASAMIPDNREVASPFVASPPADNSWWIHTIGTAPLEQMSWRYFINVVGAQLMNALFVPLVVAPYDARLDEFKFHVECYTVRADLKFGAGVFKKNLATGVTSAVTGAVTTSAMGSTGEYEFTAPATNERLFTNTYSYFAAFYIEAIAAANYDAGARVRGARLQYSIREASHVYY